MTRVPVVRPADKSGELKPGERRHTRARGGVEVVVGVEEDCEVDCVDAANSLSTSIVPDASEPSTQKSPIQRKPRPDRRAAWARRQATAKLVLQNVEDDNEHEDFPALSISGTQSLVHFHLHLQN